MPGRIILLTGCTFLWLAGAAPAASRPPASAARAACEVRLTERGVSARIAGASLRQVLEATSRTTGVQVVWLRDAGPEPVSVEFDDLPLADALARMLAERNFMIVLPAKTGAALPARVWVGSAVRAGATVASRPEPPARLPPYPTDEDLQGAPPVGGAEPDIF